jgi:hypothetical protein
LACPNLSAAPFADEIAKSALTPLIMDSFDGNSHPNLNYPLEGIAPIPRAKARSLFNDFQTGTFEWFVRCESGGTSDVFRSDTLRLVL